ncbi:hypothetical protein DAEQUDRAFT_111495 [Daedalea quercina L-15889]|uniref:non-specific serine/threonine protein kinase n=1 Tax=Daedalea quercina L-15889 TaxID=1314783 RepID=A0A165S5A2_9APHY|nr:hypothetical protein DAEQUDRAFT_111495 [Daedalea quercina L-15889]
MPRGAVTCACCGDAFVGTRLTGLSLVLNDHLEVLAPVVSYLSACGNIADDAMATPMSTQMPFPTFGKTDDTTSSSAYLLEFLQHFLQQIDNDDPEIQRDIDMWRRATADVADNVLGNIPPPEQLPWHSMHEQLKLAEISLDIIEHSARKVDRFFSKPDDFAPTVMHSLLRIGLVSDRWTDVAVDQRENYLNPEDMRKKVSDACRAVLDAFGKINQPRLDKDKEEEKANGNSLPLYETQRRILSEYLAVCNDIHTLPPATQYPLRITFFTSPRIRAMTEASGGSRFVEVDTPLSALRLLVLLCELCARSCFPSVTSQWYLSDLARRAVSMVDRTLYLLLSTACSISVPRRVALLSRLAGVVFSTSMEGVAPHSTQDTIRSRLVLLRLQLGPSEDWKVFDVSVKEAIRTRMPTGPSSAENIQPILMLLRTEQWGEEDTDLRAFAESYLLHAVTSWCENDVRLILDALDTREKATYYPSLLHAVKTRQNSLRGEKTKTVDAALTSRSANSNWRALVKKSVETIIEPDRVDWMDDENSFSDTQYMARAVQEVEQRYKSRPLYNITATGREALAHELGRLPCTLVHSDMSECQPSTSKPSLDTLGAYMAVAIPLLDGAVDEVTPKVRKAVFLSLASALRHHTSGFGGKLDPISEMIMRGMKDKDRSVRLGAGESLVELVKLYQALGGGVVKRTESLFATMFRLFETTDDRTRETTIVVLGRIGKIATPEVLGQTLCCLISQLSQRSPLLKATAHTQLRGLANLHKKTPYALVSPYMTQVAPFLLSKLVMQPTLLLESCRFLSVKPESFISATLRFTLPQLFGTCNVKALETIARETKERISQLFLQYSHQILAFAFRLQGPGASNKVLNFIINLLKESSQSDLELDLSSLVGSCKIPLLAELITVLGDEDPDQADYAKQALKKVERALRPQTSSARSTPVQSLSAFLKPHMLGIITILNDQLQDVYGKRTPESKKTIIRSFRVFIREMGSAIATAAPQIMATLQTMLVVPQLTDVALQSWREFLTTLDVQDLGPYIGPTSASFVAYWPTFSVNGREDAKACLDYIICDMGVKLGASLDDVVDLTSIPQLAAAQRTLAAYRKAWGPRRKLENILNRSASENLTVCMQALQELRSFMTAGDPKFMRSLASGDVFDPLIGRIVNALFTAACRDGEGTESLRRYAFECIGILGAVDPDRFEISSGDSRMVVWENFVDETESFSFVLHLIADVLVGAFRSTSDIKYQSHLAYAIQELLRFCKFSPGLITTTGSSSSISLKVRSRWSSLPKHVLETVSPLLTSRFTLETDTPGEVTYPIYPLMETYRDWIQIWTSHLLTRTSGDRAKTIFEVFSAIVRNRDVGVARHLLPHLVLHVLVSGNENDVSNIHSELLAVLEDQVDVDSHSTSDKKLLSAQTVFMLLDHISYWRSVIPHKIAKWKEIAREKSGVKPARHIADTERAVIIVDSLLLNIDQNLMAKAALQCKAYARSLMNFEQQILTLRGREVKDDGLYEYYERLHEIYAHLDEPDGMEGISTLILSPSLEHQIRQHESTGRWTSAQSCWEVRLQSSPDSLEFHLGLMRCLRNLGHYDTLRTHVKGILTRNPDWESHLIGFHVESELMVGNWSEVHELIQHCESQASSVLIARVLLALRLGDSSAVAEALSAARASLGSPIVAAGPRSYRRSYESVLDLHLVHELETIHEVVSASLRGDKGIYGLGNLSSELSSRLSSTLPTFRTQEPILSMRRMAFALTSTSSREIRDIIGDSWLATAKIARKAGHWQTAYSAMLQAQQCKVASCFLESARLVKANGEHLRALQELENHMRMAGMLGNEQGDNVNNDVIDLTTENTGPNVTSKAQLLRARWMYEADRYEPTYVLLAFQEAVKSADKWENRERVDRGMKMSLHTVRAYIRAIKYGSKFIYQTVPRLLTLWLDMGEHPEMSVHRNYGYMITELERAIKTIPVYKWYTAFPQIVSRVGHSNETVYKLLSQLVARVIQEYPKQSLWLFVSAVQSNKAQRSQRGRAILDGLKATDRKGGLGGLINESLRMVDQLLELCIRPVPESKKLLNMQKDFPGLYRLAPSQLIVPLQDSLTANVPPASIMTDSAHQPFPPNAPLIESFLDEVEVMKSLARPKKIALRGSDGHTYMFLGKPKDDLRKDARLMDFNMIINKLLKANSESRRRQLYIRTYGVVTLNEECGFIQWVPNTAPIRPILNQYYDRIGVKGWNPEMNAIFMHIKALTIDKEAAAHFEEHILSKFPPMFHHWFLEQFPEPTAWLSSRLAYSRTAAVMSMVGFILGLGDRHSENILLDTTTGDVVHVDFNCLFEKGKQLETPERVPFRLTQNIVDGFGITGVEGVFRIACEVTMQLLRDNKDTLMSVLDAFIHDPLVEWEDEKRKKERETSRRNKAGGGRATDGRDVNFTKANIDLRKLALDALSPIAKKLNGIYTTGRDRPEKETSTSNLVEMLIREASDNANLARMYPGWGPWH